MTSRARVPLRSRFLALVLGVAFAVQPVLRAAGSCDVRSMLAGRPRSVCCCKRDGPRSAGAAALLCCALRDAPSPSGGTRLGRGSCGCELNVPTPGDALPGTVDPRSPSTHGAASAAQWIAAGAQASAASAWWPVAHPPDFLFFSASRERRPAGPDAVARSSARGVNGLLAVLGVALL